MLCEFNECVDKMVRTGSKRSNHTFFHFFREVLQTKNIYFGLNCVPVLTFAWRNSQKRGLFLWAFIILDMAWFALKPTLDFVHFTFKRFFFQLVFLLLIGISSFFVFIDLGAFICELKNLKFWCQVSDSESQWTLTNTRKLSIMNKNDFFLLGEWHSD